MARFARRQAVPFEFPDPDENSLFMREVANVHRGLFPEFADDYGESIRWKLERCAEVTDAEVGDGQAAPSEYREPAKRLFGGLDLLVTPTMMSVAAACDRRRADPARPRHPADVSVRLPRLAGARDSVRPG